jgi:hypothetical protein
MSTLGQQLSESIEHITELIMRTTDTAQMRAMAEQQRTLSRQLQELIDRDVPRATEAYREATSALESANAELVAAREDANRVAGVVGFVADAADRVARLIDTLS